LAPVRPFFEVIHMLHRHVFALATATTLLAACGGGGGGDGGVQPAVVSPVALKFTAALGSAALASPCAAPLSALGSGAVGARLRDLRFYVSNLRLLTAGGGEVKVQLAADVNQLTRGSDSVALVDLRDSSAAGNCLAGNGHVAITGTVASGNYTGLAFTLGVPETLNHVDPQDSSNAPLDNTDLGWDWTGGKKHLQLELDPENAAAPGNYSGGISKIGGGSATTFAVHLGNTGCTEPTPGAYHCDNVNTREVRISSFDLASQRVAMDLRALLAPSNLRVDRGEAVGCMSSPTDLECQDLWPVLGASFTATGANSLAANGAALLGTTVFKAIAQ
jgi:uncharacterized repeat protein (TIGR04052 family)